VRNNNNSSSDGNKEDDDIWSDKRAAQFAASEMKKRNMEKNYHCVR